jgi:hypothetical protein
MVQPTDVLEIMNFFKRIIIEGYMYNPIMGGSLIGITFALVIREAIRIIKDGVL